MPKFSRDLGIDLGTSNVLIYENGKGIVLEEPSVVAVDKHSGKVLQIGQAASNMLGRTPGNVVALHPLRDGVISDYEMTEKMLAAMLRKLSRFDFVKPRVVVSVPSGISEVEERAVIQATMEAGARRVYLLEEPFAAALGLNLDLSVPSGQLVVDIGGGTTDAAVLTMNNVALSASVKVAGDTFSSEIIRILRRRYNMLCGSAVAERVKLTIGSVYRRGQTISTIAKGRDLKTGLPREAELNSDEIFDVFRRPARQITDMILSVMEQTTPELAADIAAGGITLTGGGAQLWGFPELIAERTGIACRLAEDPATCVVEGCGKSLDWISQMQEGTINLARKKLLKE